MAEEILTPLQKKFISLFAKNETFCRRFYLTGGTALAAYYLNHRYSEDLDFFSYNQIDILALDVLLRGFKSALKIKKTDFQQSFNRNIFFLHSQKEILKVEFTYFPFESIQKPIEKGGICIDSLLDIATNKIFTIYQNPRARDFIDLYYILKKYNRISFCQLIKMARNKFDCQLDPTQLGTQLFKAKGIMDLPKMRYKTNHTQWRNFFLDQTKSLSKDIFK